MLKRLLYCLLAIIAIAIAGFALWIYSFGHSFMKPGRYTDAEYFHIKNRISFNVAYRGEILDSLLVNLAKRDSSCYTIHENLSPDEMPDSSSHCWCYCGNYTETLKFATDPKEIYLVTYDQGGRSVGIDWILQFKNNKWKCHPTSTLDTIEQQRVENRFKTILKKFPLKDTSAYSNTWQGHSVDYDFEK